MGEAEAKAEDWAAMANPPDTDPPKAGTARAGVLAPLFGRSRDAPPSGPPHPGSAVLDGIGSIAVGVVVVDAEGAVTYANEAAASMLGGGTLADLVGEGALTAGVACELSVPRDGGHTLRLKAAVAPLADGAALWTLDDITERHAIGIVDRAERDAISAICDALPGAVCVLDSEDRIVFANKPFAQSAGLDARRVAAERPDLSRVLETRSGERGEWKSSGEAVRLAEGGTLGLGDGGIGRVLLVSRSGPETSADTAVSLSEAAGRLRGLFAEAPVGIALLGVGGEVREANPAFVRLLGVESAEALSDRPLVDLIAAEDRDDIAAQLSKMVMGAARGGQFEVRFPKLDTAQGGGEVRAQLYASRFLDADGDAAGLIVHAIDTTEHRALEVQFAQSQKMQAIGQLAGGVAHDFNNLLTAMIGFADLLLIRHGPDDPSYSDLMQIKQNANRATNLVRQLLAFSRKQTLEPEIFDTAGALTDLSNLLIRLLGETVRLDMVHGEDVGPIRADRGQFDQVIVNLAVNARDAMPGGGTLGIKTRRQDLLRPMNRAGETVPAGTYVVIEVSDTGTGIARENLERIFEPFFSTKDVGQGTGLGLSTVHGIIHQTDGFIFVDSAVGEGTTFSIWLPEQDRIAPRAQTASEPETGPRKRARAPIVAAAEPDLSGRGTVLIVEDEDAVRMFGSRALKNKGYTVLEARDGEEALEIVQRSLAGQEPAIDLVVSDVVMPGMDGHTLVRLIRQEITDLKIVLMSGYAEDAFRDEIGRDETIHFLGKPFTLKSLAGKVKDVLAGGG